MILFVRNIRLYITVSLLIQHCVNYITFSKIQTALSLGCVIPERAHTSSSIHCYICLPRDWQPVSQSLRKNRSLLHLSLVYLLSDYKVKSYKVLVG